MAYSAAGLGGLGAGGFFPSTLQGSNNFGGFSPNIFGQGPITRTAVANPINQNTEMAQAYRETKSAEAGLPQPLAQSLDLGLQMSQWSQYNPDPLNQGAFKTAFDSIFGPGQNQIGGDLAQGQLASNDPTVQASGISNGYPFIPQSAYPAANQSINTPQSTQGLLQQFLQNPQMVQQLVGMLQQLKNLLGTRSFA